MSFVGDWWGASFILTPDCVVKFYQAFLTNASEKGQREFAMSKRSFIKSGHS
jgi:hypothetical protein